MTDVAAAVFPGVSGYDASRNADFAVPPYTPTCRSLTPSPAMRRVWDLVAKIAPSDGAVLIRGEPGVGKETIAREIHRKSGRAGRPFVRVPCGAICEEHLDAELFGRDGYRLLDNEAPSSGLLARSAGGTLFLKGISDLPFWAQVKLLDVLQQEDRQWPDRIGGSPLDVRPIATTSCDLEAAAAEGRFHAGLYYHVNIVEIRVPPLRERPEDVKPLAESFLVRMSRVQGPRTAGVPFHFSEEAWKRLLQYDWPGNARELASVVAHAVALSDRAEIGVGSVAVSLDKTRSQRDCEAISVPLAGGLKRIERSVVGAVIERCGGNKAKAARVLGLHRRTLYRLLQDKASSECKSQPGATDPGADL
jgi:DNA-binding NtrC family response regulator